MTPPHSFQRSPFRIWRRMSGTRARSTLGEPVKGGESKLGGKNLRVSNKGNSQLSPFPESAINEHMFMSHTLKIEPYVNYLTEPKYDVRRLPVGGWRSSHIGIEKDGNWARFVDPDTHDFINKTQRIDYTKPYVPPRRQAMTPRRRRGREELMDEMFVTALSRHAARPPPSVPTIDITPEMLSGARLPKTGRPSTSTAAKSPRSKLPVKTTVVTIDSSEIPQTARLVDKRRGNSNLCPFRVSSVLVEAKRQEKMSKTCRGTEKKCARCNP